MVIIGPMVLSINFLFFLQDGGECQGLPFLEAKKVLSNSLWRLRSFGKSKRGAHKRGLKPQFYKENQKSAWKTRPFRAFPGPIGAFWADRDQVLRTSQPLGEEQKLPQKGLFGPIGLLRQAPVSYAPVWISLRDVPFRGLEVFL